jgi:hypothetical protein
MSKGLELGMALVENLVLALGSVEQYSRQKYMPLRHAWLRIETGPNRNRNICNLSDSQAVIKARGNHLITSKLIWDCH